MGTWMDDITKQPTPEEKIDFAKDAGGIHLYWADMVVNDPYYSQLFNPDGSLVLGSPEFHEECAILHGDTAEELEELARLKGKNKPGCLLPFWRSK